MEATPDPASLPLSDTDVLTEYGPFWQLAALHRIELVGAVLSNVTERPGVVASLPAVSTAWAVIVTSPSGMLCELQSTEYGAAVAVPTTFPLTSRSTWSMPERSLALASRLT